MQVRCTLGLRCAIVISGVGLEGSSALVLLAAGACGDGDAVVANWTGMMNPTRAAAADGANATYDFGIPVAGRVGFYRACWSHNFSTIEDFGVEIDASAVLAGPQPASLECTLGRNCTLSLEGQRGATLPKIANDTYNPKPGK